MKTLTSLVIVLLLSSPAFAQNKKSRKAQPAQSQAKTIDMGSQLDSLSSNEEIIEKARAIQPNNSMRIVQKRQVDRSWRPELGLSYGMNTGGDSYVNTANLGVNLDLHITPRWSLGLRYIDNRNELTNEGQRVFDTAKQKEAKGETDFVRPSLDYPLRTYLAMLNWYPIYGKISWLEMGVSQFDFYFTGGGGQVQLQSGSSAIYTGGAGMGLWWNSWLTTRIEVRYQSYKDHPQASSERSIDSFVGTFGIGIML